MEISVYKKNKKEKDIRVLMVGPHDSVKGGIRTVVYNYLKWDKWNRIELIYVPAFIEKNAAIKILFYAVNYLKIVRICCTDRIDIVHLHMAERGSFYRKAFILLFCRWRKIRTVIHHHGAEFLEFYDNSSLRKKKFIKKILKKADMNLMLSRFQEEQMKQRFPGIATAVLYNAVEGYSRNAYDLKAGNLLFLGRLCERKGVYDLLKALAECDKTLDENIMLYLCGDGEISRVEEVVEEYGLQHRISFIGWCSPEQVQEIYKNTMLYILPSYHEGLPMSLLETMSYGIPCVASNVAAIPEVIKNKENGLLIRPGNIEEIKEAILLLAGNAETRERMSEAGFRTVNNEFLMEGKTADLEKIYDRILEKGLV